MHINALNYMLRLGLRGKCTYTSFQLPIELARGARQLKRDLSCLYKYILLEVQDEKNIKFKIISTWTNLSWGQFM